jgi:hypothetical protein
MKRGLTETGNGLNLLLPICSIMKQGGARDKVLRCNTNKGIGMQRDQNWQRRHAIQIVAQLPESNEDALMVLELAKELVQGFLCQRGDLAPLAEVVAFPASASSR